jgi:hypothetical protein
MGKRKLRNESERFRAWTQHIYQRFASVLDDDSLDGLARGDLSDFVDRNSTQIEKESLVVNLAESRVVRHGLTLTSSNKERSDSSTP